MRKNSFSHLNSNWLGKLELNFSLKQGRSILVKHSHSGPFFVQKSFYPKNDNVTPHVYLLHPPGGLVGGDKLVLLVQLEPGSQALLTTPGSSKFYSTNGMYALQEYIFKLKKNTVLEWIPQSNIFFPNTKAKIKTVFSLEQGARIIFFEMLCFRNVHLKAYNKPEAVDIFLNIALPSSIGLQDHFKVNAADCISKLNGFQISASFFATPVDSIILKQVRKLITSSKDDQLGGATLLDDLLVVRLLGNDNQKISALLRHIWSVTRLSIIGKTAVIPRIWLT